MENAVNAAGKEFKYGDTRGRVVGVMGDFHFESMHQTIIPLVMIMGQNFNNLSIKIAAGNITASIASLEKNWKRFFPETPFDYNFLDERYTKLYESEMRQASIFTAFACIAILIACLGLFGLSAFAISQRLKEISVRKVLGADLCSIVALLSKDFLKLVGIAAVIAFPVGWYAMHSWLKDFAHRIQIQWWIFIAAGVVAALIAFVTISV